MYATSSRVEETRRKGGWRKIVETQFGMKSWFHAAPLNNGKNIVQPLFGFYLEGAWKSTGLPKQGDQLWPAARKSLAQNFRQK